MKRISTGWTAVLTVNLLTLGILAAGLYTVTERYIERKSEVTVLYEANPLRRQVMVPCRDYRLGDREIRINCLGFRGIPPSMPRPPGTCRAFVLGGSAVYDHALTEGRTWAQRLAPQLREQGVHGVETFNAGIPGYSSRETLAFYHDVIRFLEPDVVLLYQGWNDVKYMKEFRTRVDVDRHFTLRDWQGRYAFLRAPRPWRNFHALGYLWHDLVDRTGPLFEGRERPQRGEGRDRRSADGARPAPPHEQPTSRTRSPSPKRQAGSPTQSDDARPTISHRKQEWAATEGLRFWRRNVEAFVHGVLSDGAVPVLVAQNTLAVPELPSKMRKRIAYQWIRIQHLDLIALNEAMVDVLRDVADTQGIPFIDLRSQFNGNWSYFWDHVHMSPIGSEHFARLLAVYLADLFVNDGQAHCRVRNAGDVALQVSASAEQILADAKERIRVVNAGFDRWRDGAPESWIPRRDDPTYVERAEARTAGPSWAVRLPPHEQRLGYVYQRIHDADLRGVRLLALGVWLRSSRAASCTVELRFRTHSGWFDWEGRDYSPEGGWHRYTAVAPIPTAFEGELRIVLAREGRSADCTFDDFEVAALR